MGTNNTNRDVTPDPREQAATSLTFGRKGGCYVTKAVGVLLVILFVSATVATALLVYYFVPAVRSSAMHSARTGLSLTPTHNLPMPITGAKPDTSSVEKVLPSASVPQPESPAITASRAPTGTAGAATTYQHSDRDSPIRTDTDADKNLRTDGAKIPQEVTLAREGSETDPTAKRRPDVRLPKALKPLRYLLKLQPFVNGDFSIRGYVEVEMVVLEATSNITLHINNIITKNDTVRVMSSDDPLRREPIITHHTYDQERQFYIATLAEPLEVGKKYVLSMAYLAHLNTQLNGFYKSRYQHVDGTDRWVATTMFQPTAARRAFPCFDEPGLRTSFEVFLAREEHMTSLSNMPLLETYPMEGQPGWVWDHYPPSVPMSTYLVAFSVSDFKYIESSNHNNIIFRVWTREEVLDHAHYALKIGETILTFFERYFDVAFPLPKLDSIAVPEPVGGMENWGLVLYGEPSLLFKEGISSARNLQNTGFIVAHELAHQWFGNLVTPKWWTQLWLNEGFASFAMYIAVDQAEPAWRAKDQFIFEEVQSSFNIDCLENSHPIHLPVEHPDDINQIFDRVTYGKGSSIIRMMSHFLTEATFRSGLKNYLSALQFGNADQDDLWDFLTAAAHRDRTLPEWMTVKMIMDTWTLKMGYPVLHVVRSGDGTSATITQKRFLLGRRENESSGDNWWIPITYTSGDNPDFELTQPLTWMNDSGAPVVLSYLPEASHWVVFNLQQTGYYRVNYDHANWNLIAEQLLTNHHVIHVRNRAQIIDDAMDLARAGELSYATALRVLKYLSQETDYVPWASALDNLQYLHDMFTHTADYGALRKYLLDLVVPLYQSVGFWDDLQDPHLEQYKRVLAVQWACRLEYSHCVENSVTLFHNWMFNPANQSIISPNLRSTVYCTAVAAGGQSEWNFTWAQYLASSVGSEKQKLLGALGCTKKIWLLTRYLETAFSGAGGVRESEIYRAFTAVANNDMGRHLAWNYLRNNWQQIRDRKLYGMSSSVMTRTTGTFKTTTTLREMEAFKEEHEGNLGPLARDMKQALETVNNNIKWMDANYANIVEWITSMTTSN